MLVIPVLIPLLGGLLLLLRSPKNLRNYGIFVLACTSLALVGVTIFARQAVTLAQFPFGLSFAMELDEVGLFFSGLALIVWWVALLESGAFLPKDAKVFYGFFLAVLGSVLGACFSDNLVTFYLFFEMASLLCIPIVAYDKTEKSVKASHKYLLYSIGGAFLGLIGLIYFCSFDLPQNFVPGGIPDLATQVNHTEMLGFYLLAVVGFGCKSGLFPLHGWLTSADPAAPTPGAAILSGVNTKLGVLAILRLSHYVVGSDLLQNTTAQRWALTLSMATILMGSLLAYREKQLAVRLAYSTISQVAYVTFSLFLFQELAFVGGMFQVAAHGLGKALLFLCAGHLTLQTGETSVKELQKHPINPIFILFGLGSLSLVGIPFTGGFVAKWYMGTGAMAQDVFGIVGVFVLIFSAIFTARYLFPLVLLPFFVDKSANTNQNNGDKPSFLPILVLLLLGLGIYPLPLLNFLFDLAGQLF